jgi:hypothetical protein
MRWLAIISTALALVACAGAPTHAPNGMTVAIHPPPTLDRPWLVPRPSDEVILLDTRTLRALRELDETQALNASGSGPVKRPGLWLGIGLGAVATGFLVAETMDADSWCFLGSDCD